MRSYWIWLDWCSGFNFTFALPLLQILTTSLIVLVCAWLGAKRLTLQWCWIETHKVWCLTGELKSIRWLKAATEYKALNLESKFRFVSSPEHLFLFGLLVFYVWYNRIHGADGAESESHGCVMPWTQSWKFHKIPRLVTKLGHASLCSSCLIIPMRSYWIWLDWCSGFNFTFALPLLQILTTSLIVLVCAWLGAKRLTLQWCWIETHKVWCLTGELKSIRWLKAATEYKALNLESKFRFVSSPEHLFLFGLLVFYVWYNRIHGADGAESESHGCVMPWTQSWKFHKIPRLVTKLGHASLCSSCLIIPMRSYWIWLDWCSGFNFTFALPLLQILTTSLIVLVCAWLGAKRLTLQWCWIETHKVWCLTGELKSIRWLKAATEYKALNLESKFRFVSSPEHLFLFGLLVFYVWYNRIHGADGAESESHGCVMPWTQSWKFHKFQD